VCQAQQSFTQARFAASPDQVISAITPHEDWLFNQHVTLWQGLAGFGIDIMA
jgi:hypothetical protein